MDESFNISFWKKSLYLKIEDKLKNEYCEVKSSPIYQARLAFYRQTVKSNQIDLLIQEYIKSQDRFDPKLENLETGCH